MSFFVPPEDLLAMGADPDRKNHNGLTPLFCAMDRGRPRLTRLLLDAGADPATRGFRNWTLLHMAARNGDWETAQYFLDVVALLDALKDNPDYLRNQNKIFSEVIEEYKELYHYRDRPPEGTTTTMTTARDPNIKYGPEGHVQPGQTLNYDQYNFLLF